MSSKFHYIAFRASAHATEEPERVAQALRFYFGEAPTTETVLEGHHKNPIVLYQGEAKARPQLDAFWRRIQEIPRGPERLLAEVEERMDDDLNFYLRLSKQDAYLGVAALARDEDAIQVRVKVAAFPAKPDVARARMTEYLRDLLPAPEGPVSGE